MLRSRQYNITHRSHWSIKSQKKVELVNGWSFISLDFNLLVLSIR